MLIDKYAAASEPAREHLSAGQNDRSSVASGILTIAQKLNICDESEICQKQTAHEVNEQSQINISETPLFVYKKMPQNLHNGNHGTSVGVPTDNTYMRNMTTEQPGEKSSPLADTEICVHPGNITSRSENAFQAAGNESTMNPNAIEFKPTASFAALFYLARPMEPCIDSAPATGQYKLSAAKTILVGEALNVIDILGHSSTAHEAAKERLERKFGGWRRQIAMFTEELKQFEQIRSGYTRDLDKFADLLDIAIINLKEANQTQELGVDSLYAKLQRKLPEAMLARYHRWIF